VKRIHWLAIGVLLGLCLVGEYAVPHHGEYWWSSIPLFYGIFGFVGCVLIIAASKGLGKLFLLKKEDYYDVP